MGDSIAHNVNMKHLESKTSSMIIKKKSYSSIHDERARWPSKNMKNVTENALNASLVEDRYDYVVLLAPTIDITNMNTSCTKPSKNLEAFKHEIVSSCKNTYYICNS